MSIDNESRIRRSRSLSGGGSINNVLQSARIFLLSAVFRRPHCEFCMAWLENGLRVLWHLREGRSKGRKWPWNEWRTPALSIVGDNYRINKFVSRWNAHNISTSAKWYRDTVVYHRASYKLLPVTHCACVQSFLAMCLARIHYSSAPRIANIVLKSMTPGRDEDSEALKKGPFVRSIYCESRVNK